MRVIKEHDARITVWVDGENLGPFDEFSPPDAGSEVSLYRPGGSKHAIATPGLPTIGTGTATKALTRSDAERLHRRLLPKRGEGRMVIADQATDGPGGDPIGDAVLYSGLLMQVELSDYDADGNDNRTVTLTIQPDTQTG